MLLDREHGPRAHREHESRAHHRISRDHEHRTGRGHGRPTACVRSSGSRGRGRRGVGGRSRERPDQGKGKAAPSAKPSSAPSSRARAAVSVSAPASASAAPSASASASAAMQAPQRAVPAVSKVADAIAQSLGKMPAQVLVTSAALTSDPPALKGDRLAQALVAQIAGRFQNGARAHDAAVALRPARAAAATASASVLVHLAVEIAAGKLRVAADVYPVPQTVWAKIRDPEPAPVAHAFAEAPIDAEVPIVLAGDPARGRAGGSRPQLRDRRRRDRVRRHRSRRQLGARHGEPAARDDIAHPRGKVEPLRGRAWTDLAPVSPARCASRMRSRRWWSEARGRTHGRRSTWP